MNLTIALQILHTLFAQTSTGFKNDTEALSHKKEVLDLAAVSCNVSTMTTQITTRPNGVEEPIQLSEGERTLILRWEVLRSEAYDALADGFGLGGNKTASDNAPGDEALYDELLQPQAMLA